jgi:hypothetical protein
MLRNDAIRRGIYVVAGIVPATLFSLLSFLAVLVPPFIIWTAAAWVGLAGLIRSLSRRPYDEIQGTTSLMLICGVIAMLPVTVFLMMITSEPIEWREDYLFVLALLGSISTLLVALHYLCFQACLLLADCLSGLILHNKVQGNLYSHGERVGVSEL